MIAMFLFTLQIHGAGHPGVEMIRFLEAWEFDNPLLFDRLLPFLLSGSGPWIGHMGGMNH